jgi:hypothetical protein
MKLKNICGRIIFAIFFLLIFTVVRSQRPAHISVSNVTRVEKILSDDSMEGRQVYTAGIEKAASFIAGEFQSAGLKFFPGNNSFRQTFNLVDPVSIEASATVNGMPLGKKEIFVFTADSSVSINEHNPYRKIFVRKGDDFFSAVFSCLDVSENLIIVVDTSFGPSFARWTTRRFPQFVGSGNRIFILSSDEPKTYQINILQKRKLQTLTNIIGILPGKSKPDEYVIFSAHYDHLGIRPADASGDSVYNGANDDASGTTAVIELANYFAALNNNQRTIIFAAFTAEEVGEFGSEYFAKKIDPDKVVAMLNIEMIGTESKWGIKSAYVTGYDKSTLSAILDKNLKGSMFRFYPDPYPNQKLFFRSDNASLAKRGVPAHTISTSKMDSEPYYHQRGDEFKTLDMDNMTEIIRSIALSMKSIIGGEDAPSRVKPD